MDLMAELEGLLAALEAERTPYALAGGLALAVHGIVRATVDIDLLVAPESVEAASRVAAGRGFRAPTELRFATGLEIRRLVKFVGEEALVLDLLRAMKLAAGRDQDLADVRRLEELDG